MAIQLKNNIILFMICVSLPFKGVAQKESNIKLANELFKSGDYLKAKMLYQELYITHKSSNYYESLLDCYWELSHFNEAENLIKKHAKKHPKKSSVLIDFAHVYKLKGLEKKSKKKISEAFNQLKTNPQLIITTANRLSKYGYLDLAIQAYEIGLQNGNKINYRFQIARIYGKMNNIDMMYENYLELIITNKSYLNRVKTTLGRTINSNPENENNKLLKEKLIEKVQVSNNKNISELLIWLFIQEKNFAAAFDQEKAIDQKFNLNQKNIYNLASICRRNNAFDIAINCYEYIIELGPTSSFYLESQLSLLTVRKELLESSKNPTKENWLLLENDYNACFEKLGKTSYTILLMRDLAQMQAFRLHDTDKASSTIQEALSISSASTENIAKCKLVYGDILLLQNEIWEAILIYSQVDKTYKHDVLGHEAKYRRSKISYFQGDFYWAQAQLDVLKKSTSKLIANDAMELSLLIQDNLNLDTTTTTMEIFSRADLLIYQNKLSEAHQTLDTIIIDYPEHSLVDEALFRQYKIKVRQEKMEDASELLDQIINFYSYDILVDDAKYALAELNEKYFNNMEKASELYEDIMMNHKDSFYLSESRKRYRMMQEK